MNLALKNPVRALPCDVPKSRPDYAVETNVRNMTWEHISFWNTVIQPLINARFRHWQPGVEPQDARADVGWDWARCYGLAILHSATSCVPGNKSGAARALAITVSTLRGAEIPVGMLTAVPQFQSTVGEVTRQRVFTWYPLHVPSTLMFFG